MEDIALDQKKGLIDRYFEVSRNHSTIRTEVLAGITTFITIAYILILNPQVLSDPYMIMGDTIMAGKIANGVFIGTCIGAFIGTALCALYAKVLGASRIKNAWLEIKPQSIVLRVQIG